MILLVGAEGAASGETGSGEGGAGEGAEGQDERARNGSGRRVERDAISANGIFDI